VATAQPFSLRPLQVSPEIGGISDDDDDEDELQGNFDILGGLVEEDIAPPTAADMTTHVGNDNKKPEGRAPNPFVKESTSRRVVLDDPRRVATTAKATMDSLAMLRSVLDCIPPPSLLQSATNGTIRSSISNVDDDKDDCVAEAGGGGSPHACKEYLLMPRLAQLTRPLSTAEERRTLAIQEPTSTHYINQQQQQPRHRKFQKFVPPRAATQAPLPEVEEKDGMSDMQHNQQLPSSPRYAADAVELAREASYSNEKNDDLLYVGVDFGPIAIFDHAAHAPPPPLEVLAPVSDCPTQICRAVDDRQGAPWGCREDGVQDLRDPCLENKNKSTEPAWERPWASLALQPEAQPQQPTETSREGKGEERDNSQPWWLRFPDLVPVAVLRAGVNPRDAAPVYIKYELQFSGKGGTGATASARADARRARAAGESPGNALDPRRNRNFRAGKGKDSGRGAPGYWITISGIKTYVTADGTQLTGSVAYLEASKEMGSSSGRRGRGRGRAQIEGSAATENRNAAAPKQRRHRKTKKKAKRSRDG